MIDIQSETEQKIRCFLVYDTSDSTGSFNQNELEGLIDTLGQECAGELSVHKKNPHPRFAVGTGKAQEIILLAQEAEADCIVFDFKITPTQQRNWEKEAQIPVYDREEIILRIFASRALTKEAVLQVELARLQYSLPRLAHSYGDMARQRGGNYGSKGSGETQLELDRRGILQKIALIKKELERVVKERHTQSKRRSKTGALTCAIVGYTNAGKSSLLNALTGAEAYVQDALFATLDPTTRKLPIVGGKEILLSDTVGFIRNLPHTLVDSFRSTLETATQADIILVLLDASDMYFEDQYKTTLSVLDEVGAHENKKLVVFNKVDKIDNPFLKNRLHDFCIEHGALQVSAKTKQGFDELKHTIQTELLGDLQTYSIPLEKSALEALIRQNGVIKTADWQDDCVIIEAWVPKRIQHQLSLYLV